MPSYAAKEGGLGQALPIYIYIPTSRIISATSTCSAIISVSRLSTIDLNICDHYGGVLLLGLCGGIQDFSKYALCILIFGHRRLGSLTTDHHMATHRRGLLGSNHPYTGDDLKIPRSSAK